MDYPDLMKRQISSHIKQHVNTAIPCEVVNVSRLQTEQTIDVQPLINRVFEDVVVMVPSIILNVPVVFPSGGGGLISFPIKVGDTVLVIYSQRSIEEWMESGGERQTPKDRRHHHRTDAIAIPGIYTKSSNLSPHPDNVEVKFESSSVSITPENVVTVSDGTSSVVLDGAGTTTLTNGTSTITMADGITTLSDGASTINMDGVGGIEITSLTLTHNGINIGATHIHGGVTSGGSNTLIPQ